MPHKPKQVAVNRYGMAFGQTRARDTYAGSGLLFRSYYRLVCLRCGWRFAGPRWKAHTRELCDMILAQRKDPAFNQFCLVNLYGERYRKRSAAGL